MGQIGIYKMLDPHCAHRRIKLVLPIPNYFEIYFCPNLTLSLKRRRKFKRHNAVKAFMKSQVYKNSIQIRLHNMLDLTVDEEGLNLSYPSIRGTSRRSWATTSACFSGDVIRRMSAELSWEMVESQIIKRVNSSATKHNKKNQCWRRNFRPEINKKALKLSWFLSINCKHEHWFFLLCLAALLFTLLIILLSTISQNSSADFLQINSFSRNIIRRMSAEHGWEPNNQKSE